MANRDIRLNHAFAILKDQGVPSGYAASVETVELPVTEAVVVEFIRKLQKEGYLPYSNPSLFASVSFERQEYGDTREVVCKATLLHAYRNAEECVRDRSIDTEILGTIL